MNSHCPTVLATHFKQKNLIRMEGGKKGMWSTLTCEVLTKLNTYTISLYNFTAVIPLKLCWKFKFCLLLKASTNIFFTQQSSLHHSRQLLNTNVPILEFYQNKRISKRAKLLTVIPVQKLCLHQGLKYKLLGARTLSPWLSANHLTDCQHYTNKNPKKQLKWTSMLGIFSSMGATQVLILFRVQGHSNKKHAWILVKYICIQIRKTALPKCKHGEKKKRIILPANREM